MYSVLENIKLLLKSNNNCVEKYYKLTNKVDLLFQSTG